MNMTALNSLILTDNPLVQLPANFSSNFWNTLQTLHIDLAPKPRRSSPVSKIRSYVSGSELRHFRHLRSLALSTTPTKDDQLSRGEFDGMVVPSVKELILKGSNLRSLEANSFRTVPGLKHLDLTSNQIERLDENATQPIGHSLETLKLGGALTSSIRQLPARFLQNLVNIQELDLGNNQLRHLAQESFQSASELRFINLQDNAMERVIPETFSSPWLPQLESIKLSFNRLQRLLPSTVVGLPRLRHLYLDDNIIKTIEKGSISNVPHLQYLDLQGNRIDEIESEALQNLPSLEYLNLDYNRLRSFSFRSLGRVGSLAKVFRLSLNYNQIELLQNLNNATQAQWGAPNVKVLQIRHNNLSHIDGAFFEPVRRSLMELDLGHNSLSNVTATMFGSMRYLQVLRLDHNQIQKINSDTLQFPALQILTLCHNNLTDLPPDIFSATGALRQLDVSNNLIEAIPNGLFQRSTQGSLESINLAYNQLAQVPTLGAPGLRYLNLSHNNFRYIPSDIGVQYPNLVRLDVSWNQIKDMVDSTFRRTPNLKLLDLSNNPFGSRSIWNATTALTQSQIVQSLEELSLASTSMSTIPDLDFRSLLHLDLSANNISTIPATSFMHLKDLKFLNLSHNYFTSIPSIPLSPAVHQLLVLDVSFNPLDSLLNNSFFGMGALDELYISGLGKINHIHGGFLSTLRNLRTLHSETYAKALRSNGELFDFVEAISSLQSLQALHVHQGNSPQTVPVIAQSSSSSGVRQDEPLFQARSWLQKSFPLKLSNVTVSGDLFKAFDPEGFHEFQNRRLNLCFSNTSANSLSPDLFKSLGAVRVLHIDLSGDDFTHLSDPVTSSVPEANGLYLGDLLVGGHQWQCDCKIGWMEFWMREHRQEHCNKKGLPEAHQRCKPVVDAFRFTGCANKVNRSMLEVLKDELECSWTISNAPNRIEPLKYLTNLIFCLTFQTLLFMQKI